MYVKLILSSTYCYSYSLLHQVTFPLLYHRGCLINFPNRELWICYVILLFHETGAYQV